MKILNRSLILIVIISLSNLVVAQTHTPRYVSMAPTTNGYYEYLPDDYTTNTSANYPLLIFFPGIGEVGNGSAAELPRVLANGTPKQIQQGIFPRSFTVNGQTFKFIVLTPQFTSYPSPSDMNDILNYAIANYRVNIDRVYLTGLSWGGGMVWSYLCSGIQTAGRIAAAVPVCGSSDVWSWGGGNLVASANVPIWATHNTGDNVVPASTSINNVNSVNNAPVPPTVRAKLTLFDANGHDAWSTTYNLNYRENNLNVYEWMLQYTKNFTGTVPIQGLQFNLLHQNNQVLLKWSTEQEINNAGFVIEKSSNGQNFDSIAFIQGNTNSSTLSNYEFLDVHPFNGENYYRLKQVDINQTYSYSPIRFINLNSTSSIDVKVNPNPIQDKNVQLHFTQSINENFEIQVFHSNGQTIMKKQITANGSPQYSISLPNNISGGIYYVKILSGNQFKTKTIRVQIL